MKRSSSVLKLINDHDGLKEVLNAIGLNENHPEGSEAADAVLALLATLDAFEITNETKAQILSLVSSEGRRELSEVPAAVISESWIDFDYGNVVIGDYVRVKPDAYDSDSGRKHNGRVGKLTYVRGYQCSIEYTGLATGNSIKHPTEKLQSLKRGVR